MPSTAVPIVAALIEARPEQYIPFASDVGCSLKDTERQWPRFKVVGL